MTRSAPFGSTWINTWSKAFAQSAAHPNKRGCRERASAERRFRPWYAIAVATRIPEQVSRRGSDRLSHHGECRRPNRGHTPDRPAARPSHGNLAPGDSLSSHG